MCLFLVATSQPQPMSWQESRGSGGEAIGWWRSLRNGHPIAWGETEECPEVAVTVVKKNKHVHYR